MTDYRAIQELTRQLDNIDDKVLLSITVQCAEILHHSGSPRMAAYIMSLPLDTPGYTAREIRQTLIQQAKINLSPQYIQIEMFKRRNDGLDCATRLS